MMGPGPRCGFEPLAEPLRRAGVPPPPKGRGYSETVKTLRNVPVGPRALPPKSTDRISKLVGPSDGNVMVMSSERRARSAKLHTTRLRCGQRRLGPLADAASFFLSKRRK